MASVSTPPNVLWISTHDINPHLGAYAGVYPGADAAVTPNLDRLAAEGVRFDNAYATAPVCAPSRSSIMTGCFPTSIGTMHMRTKAVPPPEVRLLPEYLRDLGYYTTNNWFTDFQVPTPGTAFDDWSDTAHWRGRDREDQPFFAAFHGMTTHESQIYLDDEAFLAATPNVSDEQRHHPDSVELPPYHPDTAVFRQAWARYHDLITEMDHWVGELLAQLDADGLADDTIVVFWSDHGLGMPRAKRWVTEAGLHEPLIMRWPGVLDAGTVRDDLVHVMDITPTVLRACGATVPDHMQAVPLLDERMRLIDAPNEYVVAGRDRMDEQEDGSRSLRDDRYRYTRHLHPDRSPMQHCDYPDHLPTWAEYRRLAFDEAGQLARGEVPSRMTALQRSLVAAGKPSEELYDLRADPHEELNLAGEEELQPVLERLRGALDDWTTRFGDLGLVPEDELVERWRPGGAWPVTEIPNAVARGAVLEAESPTEGALVAWTLDPPAGPPRSMHPLFALDGGAVPDGRRWRLSCAASPAPADRTVWLQAWRLGYRPSEVLRVGASVEEEPVGPGS